MIKLTRIAGIPFLIINELLFINMTQVKTIHRFSGNENTAKYISISVNDGSPFLLYKEEYEEAVRELNL